MTCPATCHPEFYFKDGIYHGILVGESNIFVDLFDIGSRGQTVEGTIDECPIWLPELTVKSFDLFVEYKFGRPRDHYEYEPEELKDFLEFTCKFECTCTRAFVIQRIKDKQHCFDVAEIVHFGIEYQSRELFTAGFNRLVETRLATISNKQRNKMSMEVYIVLVQAKAILDDYRCEVAEKPPVMQHASSCRNRKGCDEDWQSVWWNGMGRLLLDSHNPQPFGEALKRFKCLQFGRVGDACKENMFNNVVEINVPLLRSDRFITEVRDHLMAKLIPM